MSVNKAFIRAKPGRISRGTKRELRGRPEVVQKPPTPYVAGAVFEIRRHLPPEPIKSPQVCTAGDLDEQDRMTIIERCLLHPPQPGQLVNSEPGQQLRIVRQLRCGDHPAQLVVCEGNIVAKFYDPLYSATPTRRNTVTADPFRCADHDYSHETAGYHFLTEYSKRCPSISQYFPRYFGSYTCELPTPPTGQIRSVRLILMEFIPGMCMSDVDAWEVFVSQDVRKAIIAKIIDAESALAGAGLGHGDLHPRNIILRDQNNGYTHLGSSPIQVVIIDFAYSWLHAPKADSVGRPLSPLLRWDDRAGRHSDWLCLGWIDWEWSEWLEENWKDRSDYAIITEDLKEEYLGRLKDRRHYMIPQSRWQVGH